MRSNIYQMLFVMLLALGCTIETGLSGGSGDIDTMLQDVQDTLDDLDEFLDAGTETLCALNLCQSICYEDWWRQLTDIPAQCGVTCIEYPCQPVCAETDEGIGAVDAGWCSVDAEYF